MKTLADLKKIREKALEDLKLRSGNTRVQIVVGMGTSGIKMGAREVMKTFLEEIAERNLTDVLVTQTAEKRLSSEEPVVEVIEEGKDTVTYGNMTPDKAKKTIVEHIVNGKVVSDYVVQPGD
ncbi:MAG TPA: (2Fe-2S) ferredoxin domain-containing protein [Candidatus Cloacimonetes bacterium]|nr:(2Fe-2S) ferredoxin domain-containing protein [Candidatus Cloacimonadota bacterium]